MKNLSTLPGILLTVVILSGCQSKSDESTTDDEDTLSLSDAYREKLGDGDSLSNETFDFSDCVRGPAEQVIKKNMSPASLFELNPDGHTGKETLSFENGDQVIIKNWGCEYYLLTFRFETGRYKSDTTNVSFWMDKAVSFMKSIEEGVESPLNIPEGTGGLRRQLDSQKPYNLGEEIVYDDGEIRQYVSLERIQMIDKNRYAVELTYAMGPL